MTANTATAKERKLRKLNTQEVNPREREFIKFLESRLVGQPEAIQALALAYRTGLNPIRNPYAPLRTLLFVGPSRSGKSYAVSNAAEFCHGDPEAMIELEGGELQKEHEVMKLTGAPPSYLGYKAPEETKPNGEQPKFDPSAKLALANLEASRRGSKCPIVWIRINEVEKAHPALFDLLLGATDTGKINLGNNQVVNLSNCVIVMTSNLGMAELQKTSMGFLVREEKTVKDVKNAVDKAMESEFRPEFRNRIDEVVFFNPLTAEQVRQVVDFEVTRIQERILKQVQRGQLFTLEVDDKAKDFILAESDNSKGGVADMKRTLKRHLEDPLGNELIKHTINLGDKVFVTHEQGEETLSFYVDEDGALVIGAAELLDVKDTPGSRNGLVFQRKLERALFRAARSPKERFEAILPAADLGALQEDASALIHDLEEVFCIVVEEFTYRKAAPFAFKAVVLATDEQLQLLKEKYPEVTVLRAEKETGGNA